TLWRVSDGRSGSGVPWSNLGSINIGPSVLDLHAHAIPSRTKIQSLSGEWVRPNLEVHNLAFSALSTFDMPNEVGTVIGPEPATFPAGVRIDRAPVAPT